jgi:hypothetical protein
MKIKDAYVSFIELVNRNATNNNINVDHQRFVLLFNKTSIQFVSWILEKRNEDVIRIISPLLILEKPLIKDITTPTYTSFNLPLDYFELANVHAYGTKGTCIDQKLKTFEIKSENIEELLDDDSNKPSFDYREVPYLTGSKKVNIYQTDFEISKASLSYYRYPKQVDIAGYYRLDNTYSNLDIDPEFDDKVVYNILTAMAKQFSATNGDVNSYQIRKDELFSAI